MMIVNMPDRALGAHKCCRCGGVLEAQLWPVSKCRYCGMEPLCVGCWFEREEICKES